MLLNLRKNRAHAHAHARAGVRQMQHSGQMDMIQEKVCKRFAEQEYYQKEKQIAEQPAKKPNIGLKRGQYGSA